MTRHPDAGVLAEFREGLLGRRRAARIRAHLAGCPHCASADAGLAEVTELLAGAPAPRMPNHLIARLDSTLAAEAAGRQQAMSAGTSTADAGDDMAGRVPGGAAPQPDGEPDSSLPGGHAGRRGRRAGWRPGRSGGPGRRRPAVLGAAAAVMIVLAGAGYGLASLAQQQGGTASAAGSAAGRSGQRAGSGASGRSGASPHPSGAMNAPAGRQADLGPAVLRVTGSGIDYQPGTLASQAEKALAGHRAAAGPAGRPATQAMRACVMEVTRGRAPELVDVARYQGRPATIIVLGPSGGQPGKVFVTGAACSAHRPDVLDQASLPSSG